jgi:3-methylfumaryl-CoA hydratase
MTDLSLAELGLPEESTSVLPAEDVQKLAATLDVQFPAGRPLPLLWHWAFFNPVAATADLGPDGHPRRESPLLAAFPRRMWVGGEVTSLSPLRPDTPTTRRTRVLKHAQKHGSTGDLLIVTLEHTVEQHAISALVETQDVIFREAGGVTPAEGPAVTLPPATGWRETITPNTQLLFRFSAITFNSHRIHYDPDYATKVENYPGLVVHGPLTAMLLAESASRRLGRPLRSFAYRASNPLFVDRPLSIDGETLADSDGQTATMTATRADGAVAMKATAVIS